MITAADVFPALVALLFMAAAIGFLALMEYRAQQRQHADHNRVVIRRFDALAVVVVRELRREIIRADVIRREVEAASAQLRAEEDRPPPAAPARGGAS